MRHQENIPLYIPLQGLGLAVTVKLAPIAVGREDHVTSEFNTSTMSNASGYGIVTMSDGLFEHLTQS